jgi:DNA-directed RNA polymerase specialized sigma24 family protein
MTLAELFDSEYERLAAYLARHSDAEAGEDLASEAFARLASRGAASPELLWRVGLNALTDYRRNAAGRPDFLTTVAVGDPDRDGEARGFTIEQALFRADFDRAFRALPRRLAEAFTITELRGLTVREASATLGVDFTTVHRRAALARAILKEELT